MCFVVSTNHVQWIERTLDHEVRLIIWTDCDRDGENIEIIVMEKKTILTSEVVRCVSDTSE